MFFWRCSDDEGEPDDEDEEDEDDDASDDCNEDSEEEDGEIVKENGITRKDDSPVKPQSSVRWHEIHIFIFMYFTDGRSVWNCVGSILLIDF